MAKATKTKSEEYEKASFNLKPGYPWKFKMVAQMKGESMTDAINSMIEKYINTWKGEIPAEPKKKAKAN